MEPPAGYNPSVSLLEGGTAPINAVMGGGGSDGTSLLTGGDTAPIARILGGGKAKRALSARRRRRGSKVQRGGGIDEIFQAADDITKKFSEAKATFKTGLEALLKDEKTTTAMINKVYTAGDGTLWTLLSYAVYFNEESLVKELVRKGANVNLPATFPPLQVGILYKDAATTFEAQSNLLLPVAALTNINLAGQTTGAIPDSAEDKNIPLFLYVSKYFSTKLIQVLLTNEPSLIHQRDANGKTALMIACEKDDPKLMSLLLYSNSDLNAKDTKGQTAIDLCSSKPKCKDVLTRFQAKKGAFQLYIEYYSPPLNPTASTDQTKQLNPMKYFAIPAAQDPTIQDAYTKYLKNRTARWFKSQLKQADLNLPTTFSDQAALVKPLEGKPELGIILPETTETIIVVPPLRGDLATLQSICMYCESIGLLTRTETSEFKLKYDTYMIFLSDIFESGNYNTTSATNTLMFFAFLKLAAANLDNVFMVASHKSVPQILTGIRLLNTFSIDKDTIPTLLEPSYVLFPFMRGDIKGTLFTSESSKRLPNTTDISGNPLVDLFDRRTPYVSSFRVEPSGTPFGDKLVSIGSTTGAYTLASKDPLNPISSLSGCAPFLKQELITADQDIRLNAVSKRPYVLLYRVRISDADKRPYCTSFRNPVSKNQEGLLFKANTSSTLLETVAEVVPVRLGGKEYTVRYPNDTTLEDWKRLNFSESEAMFLNDLNFAPSILEAAFLLPTFKTQLDSSGNRYLIDTNNRRLTGSWEEDLVSLNVKAPKPDAAEKWKGELVSWLKGLVTFKCFQDKDLLTRTECIELGEFMNTVYDFFLKYPDAIRALPGKRKEQLEAEEKANEKLDPFTDTTLPVQTSGPGEFMSEPTGIHWMDDFQWQNVNPIEVVQPDVSGAPVSYSIGILLVKHSKTRGDEYKFGSIQVQANDIEEAKRAIKSRVMQLREKYPYYSFIY